VCLGRFYYNVFQNEEGDLIHGTLVPFEAAVEIAAEISCWLQLEDGRILLIQLQPTRRQGPSPYPFVVQDEATVLPAG
jgi:hypothetical protein